MASTLALVKEFDKVLYTSTELYDFDSQSNQARSELIDGMVEVMTTNNGIGLAAPQVGLSLRVFVMKDPDTNEITACFNPEVIEYAGEKVQDTEGCLSFPQLYLKVERSQTVYVRYQDINGELVTKQFDGIMARCFTHELEHLNGITFTKKVGSVSLSMAQKRRTKQQRK